MNQIERTKKNILIENIFSSIAGKNIKINSLVVKPGDLNLYQVIAKDSKLVQCIRFFGLFDHPQKIEKKTFKKEEVCLYYELIKRTTKLLNEELGDKKWIK